MSDSNANQRFTDLNVWKQARALKLEIYELVKSFPKEEKYELTNQLVRSVRSIPSNIAEGHGRFTYKDQIHYCIQARGSLSETLNTNQLSNSGIEFHHIGTIGNIGFT